jgi:hypothetical protein
MDKLYAIVVVNAIVFSCIFFMSNKKLNNVEIYITALFSAFLSLFLDTLMAFTFDTFYYFTEGLEPKDYIFHLVIYPMTNLLFLNYYPYGKSKVLQVVHIAFWVILSLAIEVIYVKTGIFVYENWNFTLSAISYPILYIGLYFHLKLFRSLR